MDGKKHNPGQAAESPKKEVYIVCRKIRYYREKKGMEQKELAQKLGIIGNAISNWENGRARPDITMLPKISEILEVSLEDLFDVPLPPAVIDSVQKERPKIEVTIKKSDSALLDKYHRLSRGHQSAVNTMIEKLIDAEDEELYERIIETTRYDDQLSAGFSAAVELEGTGVSLPLYKSMVHPKMDCVFPVSGDSMEPEFHDGDLVMIERLSDNSELEYGEIGAFAIHNDTYIKQYSRIGLRSLNKKYKVMRFSEDEQVYLIGRVLGVLDPDAIVSGAELKRYERIKEQMEEDE